MCAGLWCLVEGDTSCKTKLDPPLDGTECGADKVTPLPIAPSRQPVPSPLHTDASSEKCTGAPDVPQATPEMPWSPLQAGRDAFTTLLFLLYNNRLLSIFIKLTPFVT